MKGNIDQPPEGIILTVSEKMYGKNGYRVWLFNFICAMGLYEKGWAYWFRVAGRPKQDKHLSYVYLTIGGKIRFRGYYGGYQHTPAGFKQFETGGLIHGYHWVLISGPIEKPSHKIEYQGRQGFRYTEKLF